MLSGCQNASIQNMLTGRHKIASRLIRKFLNKGDFGGNIIFIDIGLQYSLRKRNTDGSTKSGLAGPCSQATGLFPNGFYQTFQHTNFDPAQDQMLFAYCQLERKMAIKETYRLYTLRAGMYTSRQDKTRQDKTTLTR